MQAEKTVERATGYSEEDIAEVAGELIEGLEEFHPVDDIIASLKEIMLRENLTLKEIRELCWEDSDLIFGLIYD